MITTCEPCAGMNDGVTVTCVPETEYSLGERSVPATVTSV